MALVVVTGGARSGKSGAAQRLVERLSADGADVLVVVFGRSAETDPEFAGRIARHRVDRPETMRTIEAADAAAWVDQVPADVVLMVDCLGTLLGRVMEEEWARLESGSELLDAAAESLPVGYEESVTARFSAVVAWLCARIGSTIVVTNEVGDGIVPAYATGRLFRDVLGRANRSLVGRADAAYLAVAGRLLDLSRLPYEIGWPTD